MNKPVILFYDLVCPKAYDPDVAEREALGGTEATIIRIAEELSKEYTVYVAQHNRIESKTFGANYTTLEKRPANPTHVVSIRHLGCLEWLRGQYKNAKMFVWLQDIVGKEFQRLNPVLLTTKTDVICVSQWHKTQTREILKLYDNNAMIHCIYNPVARYAEAPDNTIVDQNKLVFFSSPHKGLIRTLEAFKILQAHIPALELHIANPGYLELAKNAINLPNVKILGELTHKEVIKQVRSAFAVFHMNDVFPETFGIVYAEANAVGTPFLVHKNMGAMHEIAENPNQFINVNDDIAIFQRINQWRAARPIVRGKPTFKLDNVVRLWHNLIRKQ